jgi:hypothetical protein
MRMMNNAKSNLVGGLEFANNSFKMLIFIKMINQIEEKRYF